MGDHWYVIFIPITLLLGAGIATVLLIRKQHKLVALGTQRMAEIAARTARSTVARATVVQSHTTTTMPGRGAAVVELRLDVTPPSGERYAARTKWEINLISLPLVQSGQTVTVKIDPQDPAIIYPGEVWAKPWLVG
ncbi:hypothetical protein [Sorangium sp. So ce131]|uniref:hypothetical protein n=1 Tax=Sorangium sp. So ce131 TaxID=3133282 RepID=UPI003F60078F